MKLKRVPIEASVALYLIAWIPYFALNRGLASVAQPALGRPMTGLEILPASMIFLTVFTYLFLWAGGWWKLAPRIRLGPVSVPRPAAWTALAGVGAAGLLLTVPLSVTFKGVSIPFVQLLMRGDVLIIAPLVDLLTGRRVRWWSWTALALVALALVVTVKQRGGLNLPVLAIVAVAAYCIGYLIRLIAMSKVSKTGREGSLKRYYVEEQLVATPFATAVLALLAVFGQGPQAEQIRWGFLHALTSSAAPWLACSAAIAFVQSVLAASILLDPRENAFCVAMERAGSILGGLAATYVLWFALNQPAPTPAELFGAALLAAALVLLGLAPRIAARRQAWRAGPAPVRAE